MLGYKPKIEMCIFKRLCQAFGVHENQIDNNQGTIELLIGLKCQALQASKVIGFVSDEYKDVGIYESPLVRNFMFMGATEAWDNEGSQGFHTHTHTQMFRCETMDLKLKRHLDAEEQFQLADVQCEVCAKYTDCITCKAARSSSSIEEMEQDIIIKDAIKQHKQLDGSIKLCLEYPIKQGLDLAYLYSASKTNARMARLSTESLRKKLIREGKIETFNSKVWEGVTKGQYVIIDKQVQAEHENEPVSY